MTEAAWHILDLYLARTRAPHSPLWLQETGALLTASIDLADLHNRWSLALTRLHA
jgi:hypothetical protein